MVELPRALVGVDDSDELVVEVLRALVGVDDSNELVIKSVVCEEEPVVDELTGDVEELVADSVDDPEVLANFAFIVEDLSSDVVEVGGIVDDSDDSVDWDDLGVTSEEVTKLVDMVRLLGYIGEILRTGDLV